MSKLREDARGIWQAAVGAVRPGILLPRAFADPGLAADLASAGRILIVGGGKAGAAMAAAAEEALADRLARIHGWLNVPAGSERTLRKVHLHPARAAGSNQPTEEGLAGAREILRLASAAEPDDVALCLLSGGGSALLPAPTGDVTLADKQQVTRLLHASGATINEMNAVRKHLSAIKGGRLAEAFRGRALYSLIISDVVGDPLDVIASGPTAPDPSTFADALAVLHRHGLEQRAPATVLRHLQEGLAGKHPETPKCLPAHIHNLILGNNAQAVAAAENRARQLGYRVLNLGSFIEGETRQVALVMAGVARAIRAQGVPLAPPACILLGGETTVTLGADHGTGGRNQEFVLAFLLSLETEPEVVVLSGGTDGEDGPTDAAGALGDAATLARARQRGLNPATTLERHDAYPFFRATGDLLVTGLTETNVMDVRVILVGGSATQAAGSR